MSETSKPTENAWESLPAGEDQQKAKSVDFSKNEDPKSSFPEEKGQGRIIIVFSTKGGVGKTLVSTNLAVALSQKINQPVCLLDLDVTGTGDVARMLGITLDHTVVELGSHLKRGSGAELSLQGLVAHHPSGIHVVQALSSMRQINLLDAELLNSLFGVLKKVYPYIVVDCGKGLNDQLFNAFDAANLILMVATPDVICLHQSKWAMNVIEGLLLPSTMVKGVINRVNSRGGVSQGDVHLAMPCEVIGEIPSEGNSVGNAVNQGAPVVTLYNYSKITNAFKSLAAKLIEQPELFITQFDLSRKKSSDAESFRNDMAVKLPQMILNQGDAPLEEKEDEVTKLKRRVHARLVDELDLKQTDILGMAAQDQLEDLRERCRRIIANLLARELGGLVASHELRTKLVKEILAEALGLGPIEEFLEDPSITDILINTKDQIYVERRGRLELTSGRFTSDDQLRAVIERIVAPLGRRIDEANPMVDARLPDGSRVNAVIPPLSVKGPMLSIRKFGRVRLTEDDLVNFNSATREMIDFIQACVLARKNIIISGGTGSGKTTVLNVISSFIPENERIITIEDAAELRLSQTHWVSLEARLANVEGKGQISIRDLFRNALRMRPDRILIGECRGEETLDMLQAMNTGHSGSITTIHANSPKDVVSRLDSMVLMSEVDLPIRAIREMVSSAVQIIIHTARLPDGARKIMSITELLGIGDESEMEFRDLFVFNQTGVTKDNTVVGTFEPTGYEPSFLNELKVKGIKVDPAIFKKKFAE